ncbi:1-phosphofructokinase [Anoxybacillus tepidamans]|uniref:1-phosphofructokinase n=1 Tax=Anoxybacteroides tepidamans TaxID=265948 RepID=UPI00048A1F1C|nr:1-phosphofructokinase [Anoxybacillus tepidamans]
MIYTCTLNPSVDYIVEVDDFHIGELNRATKTTIFPGGKGINVSRVLKRLGVDNTALGFIGGFTGKYIEDELQRENIRFDFVKVPGNTRINIKLKHGKETEINGCGPMISPQWEAELIHKIQSLQSGDVLVLAGSIPSSVSTSFEQKIINTARAMNVQVAVDTSGDALKQWIKYKPFFIKPNHRELGELFDTVLHKKEEAITYGFKLVELGVENVIVSLADEGALFFNQDVALLAEAPKGTVRNSVGAGDSMVAGFLAAYTGGKNIEESFAYSVAAGSATAFSHDLCTKEKVEQLFHKVKVTRIEGGMG